MMNQNQQYLKYFITGGAGFIGSHLVDRLKKEENYITVFDNLVSGKKENIISHLGECDFHFIQADLSDFDVLKNTMKGHDVVWHLGANTDIPGGNQQTNLDLKNCTIATWNVLEAMRQLGIDKILFTSSATVYGDSINNPFIENQGLLLPISLYGAGKLACEGLISAYSNLFNIQSWIFRFANVVGARMGHGVIYDFIKKLQNNPRELEILGDGKQEKPFFLVEDCIDGMLHTYKYSNKQVDVFNLGCDSFTSVTRVAEIVIEEMGLSNVSLKCTGGMRGWPGDVPIVHYNVDKIREIGWQASCTSDEAVRVATRKILNEQ